MESKKLPPRVDKKLQWLEESRDSWKDKTIESKYELQKQKTAVQRARKTRDSLQEELSKEKTAHYRDREELNQKDLEIMQLKEQLEKAGQQIEEFKKKQLLRELTDPTIILTGTAL